MILVEAGPRLLSTYPERPERLSRYAGSALRRLGVEVRTGARVAGIDADGVVIAGRREIAATVIWGAGVSVPDVGDWLEVETDRAGRVPVAAELSLPGQPEVFVPGDAAAATAVDGRPAPAWTRTRDPRNPLARLDARRYPLAPPGAAGRPPPTPTQPPKRVFHRGTRAASRAL